MGRLVVSVLTGLGAQSVDGTLGMTFDVIAASLFIVAGSSVTTASAVIHIAKMGMTLVSGILHWRFSNVDQRRMLSLGVPGITGAFIDATLLANLDGDAATPMTSTILFFLGLQVIIRFASSSNVKHKKKAQGAKRLAPLGLSGGLLDPTGGGGWGPVTVPTLLGAKADQPRKIIGAVSTAESLTSLVAALGFLPKLREEFTQHIASVIGLSCGDVIAVPLAAYLMGRTNPRPPGIAIGGILVGLNAHALFSSLVSNGMLATVLPVRTFVAIALVLWARSRDTPPGLRQRAQLESTPQSSSIDMSSSGSPSPASVDARAEDTSEGMKAGTKNSVYMGEAGVSQASERAPACTNQTGRSNVVYDATWIKRSIKTRD